MGRNRALTAADMALVRRVQDAAQRNIAERKARIDRLAREIEDIKRMTSIKTLAAQYGVSHMSLRRYIG